MIYVNKTQLDIDLLNRVSEKPKHFDKGEELFWNDEHISKGMLEAHLDPEWDAASRKHDTINKTCDWITSKLQLPESAEVIDLGCGPGLYCNLLSKKGYRVTGLDYSKRSIDFAQQTAREDGLGIDYVLMDYLHMNYINKFDLALMIYFDFGVFSNEERDILLKRIWNSLKKNGVFAFDLMTSKSIPEEKSNWSVYKQGGFWKQNSYVELFHSFYYEEINASLRQHIIIEDSGKISVYRLWDRYYSREEITRVLNKSGFDVLGIYNDLTGNKYIETSETLGVIARKR